MAIFLKGVTMFISLQEDEILSKSTIRLLKYVLEQSLERNDDITVNYNPDYGLINFSISNEDKENDKEE
jgi:hypothetical protein